MAGTARRRRALQRGLAPLAAIGIEFPSVIQRAVALATKDHQLAARIVEHHPVVRPRGWLHCSRPLGPSVGVEIERPQVAQRTGAEATCAAPEKQHLAALGVVDGVVQAAPQRLSAGRGEVTPSVVREVEGPGVVEASGTGEAMGDHHAVTPGLQNGGVAIATAGAGIVARQLRPGATRHVESPNVAKKAAGLASEHHQPVAFGIPQQGVSESSGRQRTAHAQLAPALLVQCVDPKVVLKVSGLAAEQINITRGGVVGNRSVHAPGRGGIARR